MRGFQPHPLSPRLYQLSECFKKTPHVYPSMILKGNIWWNFQRLNSNRKDNNVIMNAVHTVVYI